MYNVGGSNLAIGISLIMRDRFTAQAGRASGAMDTMYQKAERLKRQQISMARDMNATGAAIGLAATVGMGRWYREGAKFGYMMKYVSSLGGGGYKKLADRATKLGEATIFTAHQVTDGMRWMAQAGMKTEGIYNSIASIAELATATLTDVGGRGGAADWVTNLAKAFKIPLEASNIERLSDTVAKSVNSANMTLYDYGEAMKYVQSTAQRLNATLEETSAGIMVMANSGIQGSMAGTALENFLRYMVKATGSSATKRQINALSSMGLSPKDFVDARGDIIAYGEILKKVGEASKGLQGNAKVQNAIIDIFGVRGARAAGGIIDNLSDYQRLLSEIQDSKGYAGQISKGLMGTAEGSILQLISTWQTFKIKFSEAIQPMINPLVKGLRLLVMLLNKMLSTTTGQKMAMMGAAFVVIRTAVMGYRAIVLTLKLAHAAMGGSLTTQSGNVVAGYSRMTGAANRYSAAASKAGMGSMLMAGGSSGGPVGRGMGKAGAWLAGMGVGSYTKTTKGGQPYSMRGGRSTFKPRGTKTGWSLGSAGKYGKMAGRLSLPAMLAGMGLEMASSSVGGNSTAAGKGLGIAGDTLGWAGTGAMLGSIIPGVGNAVGALVGGIGGLLYSLTTRLDDATEDIKGEDSKLKSEFDKKQWLAKINILKQMGPSNEALMYGSAKYNPDTNSLENMALMFKDILGGSQGRDGDINIYIDGEKKITQTMNAAQRNNIYNLGM